MLGVCSEREMIGAYFCSRGLKISYMKSMDETTVDAIRLAT